MHLEILATDMAPTLHLKCKFSTAHHLTRIKELIWISALYIFAKLIICTLEYGEWNIKSYFNFDWLKLEDGTKLCYNLYA